MTSLLAKSHRLSSIRLLQASSASRRYLQATQTFREASAPVQPWTPSDVGTSELVNKTTTVPAIILETDHSSRNFHTFYEFVKGGIGKKPDVPSRGIRNSAWKILFERAQTADQVELVIELLPKWREMRRPFDNKDSEVFVRRCEKLRCPGLALQVFGNHPKYGFGLLSYPAALQLLHGLHLNHPLKDTVTATVLFEVYKHPPASSSLPACAMLVAACLQHRTDAKAQAVLDTLLPALEQLCCDIPAEGRSVNPRKKVHFDAMPKGWIREALRKVKWFLQGEGKEYGWVMDAIRKCRRHNTAGGNKYVTPPYP